MAEFQSTHSANPLAGDVTEGTGGLRKVRVAAKGKGKRCGAWVIYALRYRPSRSNCVRGQVHAGNRSFKGFNGSYGSRLRAPCIG